MSANPQTEQCVVSTLSALRQIPSETLAAVRERCKKATPGPWKWTRNDWNEAKYGDNARRLGFSKMDAWALLLQAPYANPSDYEKNRLYPLTIRQIVERCAGSEGDFRNLFALRRRDLKKGCGFISPSDSDQAFIAAARSDVPLLLDALEAAYAEIDRLTEEEGAS